MTASPGSTAIAPRAPAHRGARAAAGLALAAALGAGCARPAADVIVRAGDRVVTRDDYFALARANAAQYAAAPDSAKRMLLDDIVRRELLLAEAQRLGLDRDSALARGQGGDAGRLLEQALFDRLAPTAVPVSEGEVERFHSWRGTRSHVLVLYTPAREVVDHALADLARGAPFRQVSDRWSMAGVLPPGGDVGWVVPGQLVDPLDAIARGAPLNVPQGPVPAPTDGWFLVEVVERASQPTGPLEAERPFLVEMLRQRKQRTLAMRAYAWLRDAYRVRVAPGAPQELFQRLNASPPAPEPGRPGDVLGTYDGGAHARGVYTLADALVDEANPRHERAPSNSTRELESWIETQILHRVAVLEARREGLDQDPSIARRVRGQAENQLLQAVYQRLVVDSVTVGDDEVRAFYALRAAGYARRDSTGAVVPPPPFDGLPDATRQALQQQALALKREQRLDQVTTELERTIRPFEVHPERLADVPWPAAAPPLPPGTPPAGR